MSASPVNTSKTDPVPDTPKPKKDMSKVHEAKRKKAAERRMKKAIESLPAVVSKLKASLKKH